MPHTLPISMVLYFAAQMLALVALPFAIKKQRDTHQTTPLAKRVHNRKGSHKGAGR